MFKERDVHEVKRVSWLTIESPSECAMNLQIIGRPID